MTRASNQLAGETSPYLLQHAHNPVAWQPWGTAAIEEARRRDVPLFVSIGYATCYWCHVMERESFESDATAAVLNRLYVPVKVDREVRPDIDEVFMTACQVFTRWTEGRASGGWPLSIFVEPRSLKPFFVGTYFPPEPMHGRPSFTHVLEALATAWRERRAEVTEQASRLADAVTAELDAAPEAVALDRHVVDSAVSTLQRVFDTKNGGFGGAPKFPQPVYLELLERRLQAPAVAAALMKTLDAMALGGIFDQLGGGFHRYAVDAIWLVPHFEKMLYDNAQLAPLYARSFARTGDAFHAEIARRTCAYVLREMTDSDGAFFSAQDAEVDAREGGSYVWREREIEAALRDAGVGGELLPLALAIFGVDRGANFRDPHHPEEEPANVLFLADRPERLARRLGLDDATFAERRAAIESALLAARTKRKQPITDDKTLTAWNGLMIAALAECGALLKESLFTAAADRAATTIDGRMRLEDGSLARSWRAGRASTGAFLEDFACLGRGRVALFRATGKLEHLERAMAIFDEASERFADPRGGWFDAAAGANELFVRSRSFGDGAIPSGNSVMALNALDLFAATKEMRFAHAIRGALRAASGTLAQQPVTMALMTMVLDRALDESPQAVDAGSTSIHARVEPATLIARDGAARGTFIFELPPGLHINGAGAVPLELALTTLASNIALDADIPRRPLRGRIVIPFRLRGELPAEITLEALVQACDDRACHAPQRVRATAEILPRTK